MINRRRFIAIAATSMSPFAARADAWPQRLVRIVVANAPGTGTDITARFIASQLGRQWATPVIVENKVGAIGMIATDLVAKTAPDGYNILFTSGGHFSLPVMFDKLPFDIEADFTPVAAVAQSAIVMFVPSDSSFKSVRDVIDAAKRQPDTVTYATATAGTPAHLAGALFGSMAEVSMRHVPYKVATQAIVDVGTGQVAVGFNGIAPVLPLLAAGKIRVIAVTSPERSQLLPQVPTLHELGLKGYDFVVPILALARAGTPEPVVEAIGSAVTAAAATPEFRELCKAQGLDVAIRGSAELRATMANEFAKAKRVVKLANVEPHR